MGDLVCPDSILSIVNLHSMEQQYHISLYEQVATLDMVREDGQVTVNRSQTNKHEPDNKRDMILNLIFSAQHRTVGFTGVSR